MNSKELGCAISSCTPEQLGFGINYGNEAYNIVCEYNPPGNYGGGEWHLALDAGLGEDKAPRKMLTGCCLCRSA